MQVSIADHVGATPARQGLDVSRLKKPTGATDGNLGAHTETSGGRAAFAAHAASLRQIIESAPEKAE
jgi:hypothetical protein